MIRFPGYTWLSKSRVFGNPPFLIIKWNLSSLNEFHNLSPIHRLYLRLTSVGHTNGSRSWIVLVMIPLLTVSGCPDVVSRQILKTQWSETTRGTSTHSWFPRSSTPRVRIPPLRLYRTCLSTDSVLSPLIRRKVPYLRHYESYDPTCTSGICWDLSERVIHRHSGTFSYDWIVPKWFPFRTVQ